MTNRSKARGTAFEGAVCQFLRANGFPYAERRALHGNQDMGDIAGIPGWVLECKAQRDITLASFMDETLAEQLNGRGSRWAALIVKRRQRPVRDAYVVMTLAQFAELIGDDEWSASSSSESVS